MRYIDEMIKIIEGLLNGNIKPKRKYTRSSLKKIGIKIPTGNWYGYKMIENLNLGVISRDEKKKVLVMRFHECNKEYLEALLSILKKVSTITHKIAPATYLIALLLFVKENGECVWSAMPTSVRTLFPIGNLKETGYFNTRVEERSTRISLSAEGERIVSIIEKYVDRDAFLKYLLRKEKGEKYYFRVLELLFTNRINTPDRAVPAEWFTTFLPLARSTISSILHNLTIKNWVAMYKNRYYLTSVGSAIYKEKIYFNGKFSDLGDHEIAILINRIARKAIHVIEEGKTVLQIAEEIGYDMESWSDSSEDITTAEERAITAVFDLLSLLETFDILELKHHFDIKATRVSKIKRPAALNLLQKIAILVEYIPTLLLEDNESKSPLWLTKVDVFPLVKQMAITGVPKALRGKLSSVNRLAYWLKPEEAESACKEKKIKIVDYKGRKFLLLSG